MTDDVSSTADVFLNCPFDEQYSHLFDAQIFTIFACGFRARSARELDDGSQTRIDKLYAIISACRYGIHDISRTELDEVNNLPRFNMPLELGIFLGAKKYGNGSHRLKRCLILDIEPFRYQKFISDLSGMDITDHAGDVDRTIVAVRNWLANVSRRQIAGGQAILDAYRRFSADKPNIAIDLGLDPNQIPYSDYETIVTNWLITAQP